MYSNLIKRRILFTSWSTHWNYMWSKCTLDLSWPSKQDVSTHQHLHPSVRGRTIFAIFLSAVCTYGTLLVKLRRWKWPCYANCISFNTLKPDIRILTFKYFIQLEISVRWPPAQDSFATAKLLSLYKLSWFVHYCYRNTFNIVHENPSCFELWKP